MKWLIYGGNGWIGNKVCHILLSLNECLIYGQARVDDEQSVESEIQMNKPDRVISLIGRTSGIGYSSIDYLEQKDKLYENIRDNLYGPFVLVYLCNKYNIHFTYMGTGCIFNDYNENEPENQISTDTIDKRIYSETDKPNFFGSSYSVVKGFTDRIMHFYDASVLNIRIRMPISDDMDKKNFIVKLLGFKQICSIENSMTVLPELLPIMIDMAHKKYTGTINLTNPGTICHNRILELAREILDPRINWTNFSLGDQRKILKAERSNNTLNTDKLLSLYSVTPIEDSIKTILYKMKKLYY